MNNYFDLKHLSIEVDVFIDIFVLEQILVYLHICFFFLNLVTLLGLLCFGRSIRLFIVICYKEILIVSE
jgi:hypothetical protein